MVNSSGTSIVWDNSFLSGEEAYAEFERTVREKLMKLFLDGTKIIPFSKKM